MRSLQFQVRHQQSHELVERKSKSATGVRATYRRQFFRIQSDF